MKNSWSPESWQKFVANQQPDWENKTEYSKVISEISNYPPLVFAGEARELKQQLSDAAQGNGFLIQGGDCAETFNDFKADSIRDKLKILLQMSVVLTYGASCNVVKLGRIAGQFAKPRSTNTEIRDGIELLSYRGDAVNDIEFNEKSRIPNPKRLLRTYNQSAATLNLLRAFTTGGFADLNKVHIWNQEFISKSPQGKKYEKIAMGERVQVDHMTVTKNGICVKHFQAWDRPSKFIFAQVFSNAKSRSAKKFLDELIAKAPFKITCIQVDGGSEFMLDFEEACAKYGIELIVLPPAKPTYNGGVERGNRIFREEFYEPVSLSADSLGAIRNELTKAVKKYNEYRPHASLKGATPMEYIQKLELEAAA